MAIKQRLVEASKNFELGKKYFPVDWEFQSTSLLSPSLLVWSTRHIFSCIIVRCHPFSQKDRNVIFLFFLELVYFPEEETEEEITDAVLFRTKLSHFFLSLSLWTDETRLQEANLFLPGLPAQYCSDKLEEIFRVIQLLILSICFLTMLELCVDACFMYLVEFVYLPRNCLFSLRNLI